MSEAIRFHVGDLVSRDGTDIQRVIEINDAGDLLHVECVKEPLGYPNDDGSRESPWCRIGDREWNLCRRYEFAGEVVDIMPAPCPRLTSDNGCSSVSPPA